MNHKYTILRSAIHELHFSSYIDARLTQSGCMQALVEPVVSVDVEDLQASNQYLVKLMAEIRVKNEEKHLFIIHTTFKTVVEINAEKISAKKKNHILKTLVPKEIYPAICDIVALVTTQAGFPPLVLNEYNFEQDATDNIIREKKHRTGKDPLPLGYDWIIKDIESIEEGVSFLNTVRHFADSELPTYESWAIYKNLFRFMNPIEYVHPEYDECEENFWDILFHLVFSVGENISLTGSGIPEISFSFEGWDNVSLSNISLEDLKKLTSDMAATTYTSMGVSALSLTMNEELLRFIPEGEPPIHEMYLALFNCNEQDSDSDEIQEAEKLFSRLKEYSTKTYLYRK